MAAADLRVERQRPLVQPDRRVVIFARRHPSEKRFPAAENEVQSFGIPDRPRGFGGEHLEVEREGDAPGDLAPQFEKVAQFAVEALGPEMRVAGRVDQLGVDAHPVAGALDAAFDDIAHGQFAADLFGAFRLHAVGQGALGRDHEHAPHAREIGRQILGHRIGEILLVAAGAEIGERQNRDRQPRRLGLDAREMPGETRDRAAAKSNAAPKPARMPGFSRWRAGRGSSAR